MTTPYGGSSIIFACSTASSGCPRPSRSVARSAVCPGGHSCRLGGTSAGVGCEGSRALGGHCRQLCFPEREESSRAVRDVVADAIFGAHRVGTNWRRSRRYPQRLRTIDSRRAPRMAQCDCAQRKVTKRKPGVPCREIRSCLCIIKDVIMRDNQGVSQKGGRKCASTKEM